jgi:hypothetical protein
MPMKLLLAMLLSAPLVLVSGCEEQRPMTVGEFMENEAALYGTLERCERDPGAVDLQECNNARTAGERIAVIEERLLRQAREEAFEAARSEYRARLDRERELRLRAEAEAEDARLRALLHAGDADAEPEAEPPRPE